MSAPTLPPVSYNPDEDWLRPILGALLVHLLVVLIFSLAWLWSPTRNTRVAAGEGTLEASLELSGSDLAAAQQALSQSIAQSANGSSQPALPARQPLPPPPVEPTHIPETRVPMIMPDTQEHMRVLAEQQRQQEEAERQRQAALAAEQQRQQEEAERQRQAALAAEQQRQQEEAERQRQAALAAEQQRQQEEAERQRQAALAAEQQQQQEQQEAEKQQKLAELRQRREQLEQHAAAEQQRLERIRNEQRRANQAAAAASNAGSSSSSTNNTGSANASNGGAGAGGDSNELVGRYKAAIQQAVLNQWIRPETIPLGQKCRLTINQIPAGGVTSVQFDPSCPYDEAGRRSVEAAILRASPLPYRGFESVFQRTLFFNFEAQDR